MVFFDWCFSINCDSGARDRCHQLIDDNRKHGKKYYHGSKDKIHGTTPLSQYGKIDLFYRVNSQNNIFEYSIHFQVPFTDRKTSTPTGIHKNKIFMSISYLVRIQFRVLETSEIFRTYACENLTHLVHGSDGTGHHRMAIGVTRKFIKIHHMND